MTKSAFAQNTQIAQTVVNADFDVFTTR
jgi:hypothetical protein